ncbi:MAG: HAAS signaling domain-containing protein [Promethearchaeota archaeon]
MKSTEERIVRDYLKKVKEALPSWLRDKRAEVRDVLDELEEHIWNKAEELSGGAVDPRAVSEAIADMGAPEDIAKEYKRRGTPKVWISEELWPLYLKALKVLCLVVVLVNVAGACISILTTRSWAGLSALSGIWLGLFAVFTIVTVIFVALSMEGFLPEDLHHERPSEAGKNGGAKPLVKVGETTFGGIAGLVGGIILIMLPTIMDGSSAIKFPPAFYTFLLYMGATSVATGILDLSRVFLGNNYPAAHGTIHGVTAAVSFISAALLVFLALHPEILPWYAHGEAGNGLVLVQIPAEYIPRFRLVVGILVAVSILDGCSKIYKGATIAK